VYLLVADGLAVVTPGIPVAEEIIQRKCESKIPEYMLLKEVNL